MILYRLSLIHILKERLDILVVKKGLAESREKAKALIMSGDIFVNGEREDKPGTVFEADTAKIELHGKPLPYVKMCIRDRE